MTEEQQKRFKKLAKFFAIKVPIVIAVLIIMMIVSLKLVERYPDPLRQGFEDYLSRTYGTTATIGQLEAVKFFPTIHVRARDITMHNKSNAAVIDISVGYIDIQAPFTSMIFGAGKIQNLEIENLSADKNFILPQALTIQNLDIVEKNGPDQYGVFLTAYGSYAQKNMTLEAELQRKRDAYKIGNSMPFSLSIGDTTLNAQLDKVGQGKVFLKNMVYDVGGQSTEAQDYLLFDNNAFRDNNPLACLVMQGDINQCQNYTKE